MEKITYRKTLDVHKNGSQFLLQGFETADKMSRVIEISLMASGDAIDFPLESISAVMYVTTPGTDGPSINECTIKDNKVVYEVLPIVEEGITTMQLKLIETSPEGATSVLASPKFTVEVHKSEMDEEEAEQTVTYTAIENAIAMAKEVHAHHLNRIELSSDLMFRAYYEDATTYETDIIKQIFFKDEGFTTLSKSYAVGDTGARAGEDTDNSKYYSNVSKSEALNAKAVMENSKDILEEVRLHGVYTAFSVDFDTGEVQYVSPAFDFEIDKETGDLKAKPRATDFESTVADMVEVWLAENNVSLKDLQDISKEHTSLIGKLETDAEELKKRVTPVELGGTGANNVADALLNLGLSNFAQVKLSSYEGSGYYGENYKTVVPLPFTPQIVVVYQNLSPNNYGRYNGYSIFLGNATTRGVAYDRHAAGTISFEMKDNKFEFWLSSANGNTEEHMKAPMQYNQHGETYYIIAIK